MPLYEVNISQHRSMLAIVSSFMNLQGCYLHKLHRIGFVEGLCTFAFAVIALEKGLHEVVVVQSSLGNVTPRKWSSLRASSLPSCNRWCGQHCSHSLHRCWRLWTCYLMNLVVSACFVDRIRSNSLNFMRMTYSGLIDRR